MDKRGKIEYGELILPLLAVFYACYTVGNQLERGYHASTVNYGLILSIPMAVCALICVVGIFKGRKGGEDGGKTVAPSSLFKPLVLLGGMVAFVLFLPFIGCQIGIFIYLLAVLTVFNAASWRLKIAVGLGAAAMTHVIFAVWLRLPLPSGVLSGLL